MATIFTRIIDGELPGTFVWRDDVCVAFLSIAPLRPGHPLLVPRAEVDHWIDLPAATNAHLIGVAHDIGAAQMDAFAPARIGLIIAGPAPPQPHPPRGPAAPPGRWRPRPPTAPLLPRRRSRGHGRGGRGGGRPPACRAPRPGG